MAARTQKLLLVGGNGMLARKIAAGAGSQYAVTAVDLPDFDVTDRAQVQAVTLELRPDVIVNCAAYTNVDGCESEPELADRVNGAAVGFLAEAARSIDATLVHISTDYVFDGTKQAPYEEDDQPNPRSAYGRSKLLGEQALLASGLPRYFIIRTSWLYGPGGNNFVETIVRLAKERNELRIVADQQGSPTYTGDLAEAVFALLAAAEGKTDGAPFGVYHFSDVGECSWYEFAAAIVALAGAHGEPLKVERLLPINTEEYPLPAKRPAYSVFSREKYCRSTGLAIPEWQASLARYFAER